MGEFDQIIGSLAEYALENDLSPRDVAERLKPELFEAMMEIENQTVNSKYSGGED